MKKNLEKSHDNRENSIVGIERIRFTCESTICINMEKAVYNCYAARQRQQ